jgi:hypothetical protein
MNEVDMRERGIAPGDLVEIESLTDDRQQSRFWSSRKRDVQ